MALGQLQLPTLEEHLSRFSPEVLDTKCTDEHLVMLSTFIVDWHDLSPHLCLSEPEEYAIAAAIPTPSLYRQCIDAMRKWKEKMGPRATYRSLVLALHSAKKANLIDELSSIVIKSTNLSVPVFNQPTILERYGFYLKERYLRHPATVTSHFQWPPATLSRVFNLAMIKKERQQRGEISESFVRLNISGNLQKILNAKVPIDIADILADSDDCEFQERKVVLIEGAPGSGKSTLCIQICRRWGLKNLFQMFTAVILVRLRDPLVQKAETLSDLLPCQTKQHAENMAAEICANGGKGILWILDGWDEFPVELQENSIVRKLLQSDLSEKGSLYNSSVIITSRPISSGNLYHLVSSRVEVLGFTAVERAKYFKEALKGCKGSIESVIESIKKNPIVESSCYLPINASIIAHLLHCSDNNTLPETQYEIFSALVCNIILRHVLERTDCKVTNINSLDNLPPVVQKPFQILCKVAYKGVMSNKVTFSSSDLEITPSNIESSSLDLGLLQGVESLVSVGKSQYYNFLHLSMQELLAAYHMVTQMSQHEQISKFHELLHQPRFTAVFQFYAAITKLQITGIEAVVTSIIQSKNKALLLSLLNCLYEMQDVRYCQSVAEQLEGELNLCSVSLSNPLNCLSVGYFLSSVCNTINNSQFKALLSDCSISKDGCLLLMKGLTKHFSSAVTGNMRLSLDLSDNILMNDGVMLVLESSSKCPSLYRLDLAMRTINRHRPLFISPKSLATLMLQNSSLTELDLCNWKMKVTSVSGPLLCQLLKKNQTLQVLVLQRSKLGDIGVSYIAEGIAFNNTLHTLDLSDCEITAQGLSRLSQALVNNDTLQSLYLANNLFSENCAPHLETILKTNQSIKKLSLSRCSLASHDFEILSPSLAVNSSLVVLHLSGNPGLGDGGAIQLADALHKNGTLKYLNLSYCHVILRGIEALSSALRINMSLEALGICGVHSELLDIKDHCATYLQQMLMRNSSLKTLNLSYSSFTESSMRCFSLGLFFNSCLANLNLSSSVIDDASVAYLSLAIQHSESLKTLDLFNCHITDTGIESLAQCVAVNRSLTEIRLSRNDLISEKGLQLLSDCLQKNVHSQLLTLRIPSHLDSLTVVVETDVNMMRKKSDCDLLKVISW